MPVLDPSSCRRSSSPSASRRSRSPRPPSTAPGPEPPGALRWPGGGPAVPGPVVDHDGDATASGSRCTASTTRRPTPPTIRTARSCTASGGCSSATSGSTRRSRATRSPCGVTRATSRPTGRPAALRSRAVRPRCRDRDRDDLHVAHRPRLGSRIARLADPRVHVRDAVGSDPTRWATRPGAVRRTTPRRTGSCSALVTGGEGLHNNHHAAPTSATFALHGEIDPGWFAGPCAAPLLSLPVRHDDVKLKRGEVA